MKMPDRAAILCNGLLPFLCRGHRLCCPDAHWHAVVGKFAVYCPKARTVLVQLAWYAAMPTGGEGETVYRSILDALVTEFRSLPVPMPVDAFVIYSGEEVLRINVDG